MAHKKIKTIDNRRTMINLSKITLNSLARIKYDLHLKNYDEVLQLLIIKYGVSEK